MGEGGEEKQGKRNRKRREKEVNKQRREAVKLMVKGIEIMMKLEGMSMEEKRQKKRANERVEEYVERIEDANVKAIEVAIKRIVEE